jgi:hypothetical protein
VLAAQRLLQGVLTVQHKYWTYIVASHNGTLYIGMTNDLCARVRQHKSGEIEGFSSKLWLQPPGLLGELR